MNYPDTLSSNEEQEKAIKYNSGPLLIIAGAGTGKTYVIVEKIKYLIKNNFVKSDNLLALTFTEKASTEMEDRVDKILPFGFFPTWISTFHSFADKILRDEIINIGLASDYKLLTEAESILFIKSQLFKFKLNYFRPVGNPQKFIQALYQHFSRLKDENISNDEYLKYANKRQISKIPKEEKVKTNELALAYKTYQNLMIKEGFLDFSDLIFYLIYLFKNRPQILKKYQNKFKYALVDEFQDTNIAQYMLLKLLFPQKNNPKLTVVGDDSQAIYKFRGASVSNILTFMKDYSQSKLITLRKNYRSDQKILDSAYKLIQNNNPDTLESKLKISKNLISQKKENNKLKENVSFYWANSIDEETDFVANKIIELKKYYSYSDIAILARANNHADSFAKTFSQKGIPYQFLGPGVLYKQPEIKDLISYLNFLVNIDDSVSLYRILTMDIFEISHKDIMHLLSFSKKITVSLFEGVEIYLSFHFNDILENKKYIYKKYIPILTNKTTKTLYKVYKIINKHLSLLNKETGGQILYYFLEETGYLNQIVKYKTLREEKILINVSKFFKRLKLFENEHEDSSVFAITEFLKISMELGESPIAQELELQVYDAVNILTVHGSKGLEFPIVFLINLTEDRFPTKERKETIPIPDELIKEMLPEGDYHIQEERRLFYVGLTRAKDVLFLTGSKWYGEAKRERKISPFVIETLGEEYIKNKEYILKDEKKQLSIFDFKKNQTDIKKIEQNIEKFSYSQIDTFLTCPLKYKYQFVLDIPISKDASLIFGEVIHKTLQVFYLKFNENRKLSLNSLLNTYKKFWIPLGYTSFFHQEKSYKEGIRILKNYYKKFHNKNLKIIEVEKKFRFKINNISVVGKIDRIDKHNKIEIIDYKTGRKPNDKYLKNNLQLSIYLLAVFNDYLLKNKFEDVNLIYYFLQDSKKVTFNKKTADIPKIKIKIIDTVNNIKKNSFLPKKGPHCKL